MKRAALAAGALVMIAVLSACSNVQKQLRGGKQSPDEFRVASQAPLSVPPDFRLRPPEPGAVRPQEGTPTQQARQSVFRLEPTRTVSRTYGTDGQSSGEQALTQRLGADRVDPEIRQVVELETNRLNQESVTFLDSLLFWRDPLEPGTVIDAEAESQRLRTNRSLNRPVNAGETPTIKRKARALFEGIFD